MYLKQLKKVWGTKIMPIINIKLRKENMLSAIKKITTVSWNELKIIRFKRG